MQIQTEAESAKVGGVFFSRLRRAFLPKDDGEHFLTTELSIYLELVRFLAALMVVIAHMDQDGLYTSWLPFHSYGHEAVVVFFVLSGLVVTHSTVNNKKDWRQYVSARVARIYSVTLPAIVFSFAVAAAIHQDPEHVSAYNIEGNLTFLNALSSFLFLNQSWLNPAHLPLNAPYWSLCYEVWYYVLFGVLIYCRGRLRWMLGAFAALVAGPGIVAMAPLWAMGGWLAIAGDLRFKSTVTAVAAFAGSLGVVWFIDVTGVDVAIKTVLNENVHGFWRLNASQRIVTDLVIGGAVIANFVALRTLAPYVSPALQRVKPTLVFLASFTFSLYLFHRPVTKYLSLYFPNEGRDILHACLAFLVVFGICVLLGMATEHRLHNWARRSLRLSRHHESSKRAPAE